jgi:hypothetical protein
MSSQNGNPKDEIEPDPISLKVSRTLGPKAIHGFDDHCLYQPNQEKIHSTKCWGRCYKSLWSL